MTLTPRCIGRCLYFPKWYYKVFMVNILSKLFVLLDHSSRINLILGRHWLHFLCVQNTGLGWKDNKFIYDMWILAVASLTFWLHIGRQCMIVMQCSLTFSGIGNQCYVKFEHAMFFCCELEAWCMRVVMYFIKSSMCFDRSLNIMYDCTLCW